MALYSCGGKEWAKLRILADIAIGYHEGDPEIVSRINALSERRHHTSTFKRSSTSSTRQRNKDPKSENLFQHNRMLLDQSQPNTSSTNADDTTTTKSSRKRCLAVQQRKLPLSNKAMVDDDFSWRRKETPEWLLQLMTENKGTDLKLVFEKNLFLTDVNRNEGRLSMPYNSLIYKDFLTAAESKIIEDDINNNKKTGIETSLVDPHKNKWGLKLKRWEMKKKSGKGSWNYALTTGWNDVVKANGFKERQNISIWSFRCGGSLCFALATPPPPAPTIIIAQSSSSDPVSEQI